MLTWRKINYLKFGGFYYFILLPESSIFNYYVFVRPSFYYNFIQLLETVNEIDL